MPGDALLGYAERISEITRRYIEGGEAAGGHAIGKRPMRLKPSVH
jgi:hypothetical protein